MTVFLNHGHVPFAYGIAVSLPEVRFIVPDWWTALRPIPPNVSVGAPTSECTHLITSYPEKCHEVPSASVRVLVLHCESNPKSQQLVHEAIGCCDGLRVVVVSGHKRATYGRVGVSWPVIPFCIPSCAFPNLWKRSNSIVGAVHNAPHKEISDHWNAVSRGFMSLFVGHALNPLVQGVCPQNFDELKSYMAQFAVGVNVVVGDAFGMSPNEIMASGIPLVTSWCEDMPDYVFRGHTAMGARSFYSAAIPQMREDIAWLLRDKDAAERIGNAGRDMVLAHKGETVVGKLWRDVLS